MPLYFDQEMPQKHPHQCEAKATCSGLVFWNCIYIEYKKGMFFLKIKWIQCRIYSEKDSCCEIRFNPAGFAVAVSFLDNLIILFGKQSILL